MACTVKPQHVITCSDEAEFATLKEYLDRIGYKSDSVNAIRSEDGVKYEVTLIYPEFELMAK